MLRKLMDRLSLRSQYAAAAALMITVVSAILVTVSCRTMRRELLAGIDRRLFMAAVLAGNVPPGNEKFFDGLDGPDSISPEDYDRLIVAENNRRCRELGLQYLWSCMRVDDRIVFTTSTSPGHDVTRQDHARFWETHRDPSAFDAVFGQNRISYSSFRNEWGHGRMVLVPRTDARGRKYCLGASVGVDFVVVLLRQHLRDSLLIAGAVLAAGVLLAVFVAAGLSRPVEELSGMAARYGLNRSRERVQPSTSPCPGRKRRPDMKNAHVADILLVEDNAGDADLVRIALKENKLCNTLHVVEDGVAAMAFLRKEPPYTKAPRPDMVLLDLNLPRKDGREVLAEIKADPDLKRIPVVVLTTSTQDEDILRAYNLNANCYVTKPVDFEQFEKVVQAIDSFWFGIVTLPAS